MVHSFYRTSIPSGENAVVRLLVSALRERGHEVRLISRVTPDKPSVVRSVRFAGTVSTGVGPDPLDELRSFRPDVTHVHNLFPGFGDRWPSAWSGPLVASLHNYRPLCASGILFRDGEPCVECVTDSAVAGLRHACYRGSRTATLPLTISHLGGLERNRLLRRADLITVPSPRAREHYLAAGLDPRSLRVLPSGHQPVTSSPHPPPDGPRWIAAGRFVPEKGFMDLVDWWPMDGSLDLVGDGPQGAALRDAAGPVVSVLPPLDHQSYLERLENYTGFVFASMWPETQGMAVVESLAAGVPVVARTGSAGADLVAELDPRLLYSDPRSLAESLQYVTASGMDLRRRAYGFFQRHFTKEKWMIALEETYDEAIGGLR